jgi:hypothetical protein
MQTRLSDGHGGGGHLAGSISRTPAKKAVRSLELSEEELATSLELLRTQFLNQAGLLIQADDERAISGFRKYTDILRKKFGKEGRADWKEASLRALGEQQHAHIFRSLTNAKVSSGSEFILQKFRDIFGDSNSGLEEEIVYNVKSLWPEESGEATFPDGLDSSGDTFNSTLHIFVFVEAVVFTVIEQAAWLDEREAALLEARSKVLNGECSPSTVSAADCIAMIQELRLENAELRAHLAAGRQKKAKAAKLGSTLPKGTKHLKTVKEERGGGGGDGDDDSSGISDMSSSQASSSSSSSELGTRSSGSSSAVSTGRHSIGGRGARKAADRGRRREETVAKVRQVEALNYPLYPASPMRMDQLSNQLWAKSRGLKIFACNGAIYEVRMPTSTSGRVDGGVRGVLLYGPTMELRKPEDCGMMHNLVSIYPKSRAQVESFFLEQRRLFRMKRAECDSEIQRVKHDEDGEHIRHFEGRFLLRVESVMGRVGHEHADHITRWSVMLHFLLVVWNTAFVRGTPSVLLVALDDIWELHFKRMVADSYDGVPFVSTSEAMRLLMFYCPKAKCGAKGYCEEICIMCGSFSSGGRGSIPLSSAEQAACNAAYEVWKQLPAQKATGASTTRSAFYGSVSGKQYHRAAGSAAPKTAAEAELWMTKHQRSIAAHPIPPEFALSGRGVW